jgi:TrmH family RNA methyltransferase
MLLRSQVKYIQSLQNKKFRDQEGVFIAEGPKLVHELLNASNVFPLQLYATVEWIGDHAAGLQKKSESQVVPVKPAELQRLTLLSTPNLVLGVFRKPVFPPLVPEGKLSLALDDIQDPGNMGTLLRIADWFGLTQIICSNSTADVFNPKVVQSSMGSIARVNVYYTELAAFLEKHKAVPVLAALLQGESIYQQRPVEEGIVLIGNESKGISQDLYPFLKKKITIPKRGQAESLNAAVAAAILLSHLVPSDGAATNGR